MTTPNGITVSGNGGASNSVPQLSSVFSYVLEGGAVIRVYIAKSETNAFAVMSYHEPNKRELFYSVRALSTPAHYVVHDLVTEAFQHYERLGYEDNPFLVLMRDSLIEELERTIQAYQSKLRGVYP